MPGLHCYTDFSLYLMSGGYSLVAVHGLLLLQSTGSRVLGLQQWWHVGSRAQPQLLWCTGLVVLQHVESCWTRVQTHVSCISSWILYNWAPPGKPGIVFILNIFWDHVVRLCVHNGKCLCVWEFGFLSFAPKSGSVLIPYLQGPHALFPFHPCLHPMVSPSTLSLACILSNIPPLAS